jgi:hypothetical protein
LLSNRYTTKHLSIGNGALSLSKIATLKRARGGGGAARRASRTSISFDTAKFIERKIPSNNRK